MKYRRLSQKELQALEREFVLFLASNQINAEDWSRMKSEAPSSAERQIEVFSDIVLEKVLSNVQYLEFRDKHSLRIFKFNDEEVLLRGLRAENISEDFDISSALQTSPADTKHNPSSEKVDWKILSASKAYIHEPNIEKFNLIQAGAKILEDGQLFNYLENIAAKNA